MTRNEARVLKFVKDFLMMYGFSPSYKEIAEQLTFASPSQAHKICMQLVKKNKLTKGVGARNLEVLGADWYAQAPSDVEPKDG
tara:strand:- start:284 stop:532 length:249 start_codon:yes stop_codon:yes gene_type:complete